MFSIIMLQVGSRLLIVTFPVREELYSRFSIFNCVCIWGYVCAFLRPALFKEKLY